MQKQPLANNQGLISFQIQFPTPIELQLLRMNKTSQLLPMTIACNLHRSSFNKSCNFGNSIKQLLQMDIKQLLRMIYRSCM